jgi:TRAP-type C4-dicarboxylate transport system substrate-binding protein
MDFWQSTDWLKQEYSETVPILFYAAESAAIHSRQPIRKLDDLAGIKIRAPSRLIAQSMKRLGATVVGIPTPEVVPAIQRGIIDGSATSWAMGKTFKQCDVTKYSTDIPGFASVVFIFVMNKRTWTQLPEEVQKVIREESTVDYARSLGKIWDEDDNGGRNYCKNSSEIIELPAAERQRWEKAMQPEIDGWVAAISEKQRINGAALVDDVRKFMKKHNAGKP